MGTNKSIKLLFILCLFIPLKAFSQDLPKSLRNKQLFIISDTIRIDTLSVLPGSLVLFNADGSEIPTADYVFNPATSVLVFVNTLKDYNGETIRLNYRVLPIDLSKPFQHKDTAIILKNYSKRKPQNLYRPDTQDSFVDDDKLDKNGSISRGFTLGNQRDLGTLSNLNLQLSGKLNDEVSIQAAISDNNLPIQPEGNTQQLQEFDKVSIHMFTKSSGIELGDISLVKPAGYFLNLEKQTRGIRFYSDFMMGNEKKMNLKSGFSAGLAKGKYKRLKINGIEGNQGPYRLTGNNNEMFIIILSGSEKVYIDGKFLSRGEKFDYVIDYNAAEIVFTGNMPITKDSRIIVEYEYAQQLYPRMQFYQNNYLSTKKSSFWLNFYMERDNLNDPLSENYTSETRSFIASLGDSIDNAIAPNIRNVGYSNDKVLYALIDTLVNGLIYDSVYVYSNNPNLAVYQLGFLYLGENQGNYRSVISNANGKVYEWVAPENGIKQGNYEPVSLFISPKNALMANMGGSVQLNTYGNARFEMALSGYDVNTYSNFDKNNDVGYALKFNFSQGLLNKDTSNLQLTVFADYQMANKNFRPVENYYDVEFERDWNLPTQTESWQEQSFAAGFHFRKNKLGMVNGQAAYMLRQNAYMGQKATLFSDIQQKGFKIVTNISYLKSKNVIYNSDYLKHKIILSKQSKYFEFGISEESEDNSWKLHETDSLSGSTFKFYEYSVFIKEPDSAVNQYFINYKFRKDFTPINNRLEEWNNAQTAQAGLKLSRNRNFTSKSILTYRNLSLTDTIDGVGLSEDYISGRQEITARQGKGAIVLSAFYETGSGLEMLKQYQFIEVQQGQGQFTWIDYNQNNSKELDEFEPAKFPDEADYIKVFIPTSGFVRVYTTQMSHTLAIQPGRVWNKKSGLKGFFAFFSDQFAFNLMQKTDSPDFLPNFSDNDNLITRSLLLRNNLSFKSKERRLQLDYLIDVNDLKSLIINGLDNRFGKFHSLIAKYKLFKILTIYNTLVTGIQSFESEFFSWKNYRINNKSNELSLQLQPVESLLSSVSYKRILKNNLFGEETAGLDELKFTVNQEISAKVNLQAEFSYINANYSGEISSPVAYEMLNGLKVGRNMLWSLGYNQKLSKVLFLNLSYNGRYSEENPAIHNGSVQLRANF